MNENIKKQSLNVGTAAVAWYAGANALLPSLGFFTIYFLAKKFQKLPSDPNYLSLIAVAGGYAIWAMAGGLLAKEAGALIDAGLSIGLILWIWFRPGFWPFAFMLVYASASLVLNAIAFVAADLGSPVHKALFTHILIRASEIGLAVWAFWAQVRRERAEEDALIAHYSR